MRIETDDLVVGCVWKPQSSRGMRVETESTPGIAILPG